MEIYHVLFRYALLRIIKIKGETIPMELYFSIGFQIRVVTILLTFAELCSWNTLWNFSG